MQFFLNGFGTGDPGVSDAARSRLPQQTAEPLPEKVDVLIVGSGPTGLTLAAQLAAFPGITTRIVEQKSGPLEIGQADGIACRTMEMFQAFGFCERVLRESYWVNETCFWKPDDLQPQHIVRSRTIQDTEDGLSEFPHVILNQARVHDFYLDLLSHAPAPLQPDYSLSLVGLEVDDSSLADPSAFPLTAHLKRAEGPKVGTTTTIRARYVVGCDGARSAVRGLLGRAIEGDSARQAWGVMDVLAVTDFPDIRRKSAIQSALDGSMLIIPREGGYLVRFYIELDKLADKQRAADINVTTDRLIAAARRILSPYTLDVREIAWWSVYEIGQRLCARFDDLPDDGDASRFPRAFIAGDACHTHSPKAGQGMNVSMQDTFNLGWKLASVLLGRAEPHILRTYSTERQSVARDLIEFDHQFSRMFSARPKVSAADVDDVVDPVELQDCFIRHLRFTAGVETQYRPSVITGEATHQNVATGYTIGRRFHSARVVRLSDARPMHLGHTVRADGRWRIFAFANADTDAGRMVRQSSRLWSFCDFIEHSPDSPVRRHTPVGDDIDSVIEVIAILQQPHSDVSIIGLPSLLLPRKGRYGLVDYEKVYCPDFKCGEDIFALRGIDRQRGALVVVRPDQHVAQVLPLEAHDELASFFRGFMVQES